MATDGVERQRGRIGRGVDDVAVGYQAELDQGLEAVADAQHQAVAGLSRSRTASVTSGARKNAVMNLAEPSGSVAAREAAGGS